jgi:hypothetical protein
LVRWLSGKGDFESFAFVAVLAHHHGDEGLARTLHDKALSCKDSLIPPDVPKLAAALGIGQKNSRTKSFNGSAVAVGRKAKRVSKS